MEVVEALGFGPSEDDSGVPRPKVENARIVVLGAPGAGKTTLAKAIANELRCEHIAATEVLALNLDAANALVATQDKAAKKAAKIAAREDCNRRKEEQGDDYVVQDGDDELYEEDEEEDEDEEEEDEDEENPKPKPRKVEPVLVTDAALRARSLLVSGKAIPDELVLELVSERATSATAQFRGYVVEGITTSAGSADAVADVLGQVKAWSNPPNYCIQLKIGEADLVQRIAGQKCNPSNGMVISSGEVLPPPKEGSDEDEEEEEEEEEDPEPEEDEEDEDEDAEKIPVEVPPTPVSIDARAKWPLADYAASVHRPSDVEAIAIIGKYSTSVRTAELAYFQSFPEPNRFEVDATRPDHVLAAEFVTALDNLSIPRLCEPIVLEDVQGDFETDDAMLEEMAGTGIPQDDDEEGAITAWKVSAFGAHCPVSLVDDSVVVKGVAAFGCVYMGTVYAMADAAAQAKFRVFPTKYVDAKPAASFRVVITDGIQQAVGDALGSANGASVMRFGRPETPAEPVPEALPKPDVTTEDKGPATDEEMPGDTAVVDRVTEPAEEGDSPDTATASEEAAPAADAAAEDPSATEPAAETEAEAEAEAVPAVEATAEAEATPAAEAEDTAPAAEAEEVTRAAEAASPVTMTESEDSPAADGADMPTAAEAVAEVDPLYHHRGDGNLPWYLEEIAEYGKTHENPEIQLMLDFHEQYPDMMDPVITIETKLATLEPKLRLLDFFRILDVDKSGGLSHEEIIAGVHEYEIPLNQIQTDELIKRMDRDGDGDIQYSELVHQHRDLPITVRDQIRVRTASMASTTMTPRSRPSTAAPVAIPEPQEEPELMAIEDNEQPAEEIVDREPWVISNVPVEEIKAAVTSFQKSSPSCVVVAGEGGLPESLEEYRKETNAAILRMPTSAIEAGGLEACVHQELVNAIQLGPLDKEHEDYDEEDDTKDPEMGVTNLYCPVTLARAGILRPGAPDTAAKYKGKWYHMASDEARDEFVANSSEFVPADGKVTAPQPRICLIGASCTGKTLHGRRIARRYRLFHVSFHERLAEIANNPRHTHHTAAKEYLGEDAVEIEAEVIIELVKPYFTEEPYRSSGIVLEGFPRNDDDARGMAEAGLYPDVALALTMEAPIATRRAVPRLYAEFAKEKNAKLSKKAKIAADKAHAAALRKAAWVKNKEEEKAARAVAREEAQQARMAEPGYDPDEDEDEDEEEEEEEEYEDEDDEDEEEDEDEIEEDEDAKARITEEVSDKHEEVNEAATGIVELFKDELKVPGAEIKAGRREAAVRTSIDVALAPYLGPQRQSIFESVRKVGFTIAAKMIAQGVAPASKFGLWCPVSLSEGEAVQPILGGRYPAVYKDQVYFMDSWAKCKQFVVDPIKYVKQAPPPAVVPVRVAMVGLPKCGKTTLAKQLCAKFGAKYVSVTTAVEEALAAKPANRLTALLDAELRAGNALPGALVAQAVVASIADLQSQTRGYVLDGYPMTVGQCVDLEAVAGPGAVKQVLSVDAPRAVRLARAQDEYAKSDDHDPELHHQLTAFDERDSTIEGVMGAREEANLARYDSWQKLDGEKSKWWLAVRAASLVSVQLKQAQLYLCNTKAGSPAPVAGVGFSFDEVAAALGDWQRYCPASWCDSARLVVTAANDLACTVQYKGRFYQCADVSALQDFVDSPETYLVQSLPDILPARLSSAAEVALKLKFPKQLEFASFCPVTYCDNGRRYEYIKPGDTNCAAEYGEKIFAFVDNAAREKFMAAPQLYANEPEPRKLPPRAAPLDVNTLPMLGYMEQTTALLLTKAIAKVGLLKPKYPHLSVQQSAEIFIGLYLKSVNPNATPYARGQARQRLEKFERTAALTRYLGENATAAFDGQRPLDYENKYALFAALSR